MRKIFMIIAACLILAFASCTIKDNNAGNNTDENNTGQHNCGECPLLSQPSPEFCKEGKIVSGGKDECGCQLPPKCEPVACTADAKICPDGSAVGRVGPNCEFAACPDALNYTIAETTNESCVKDSDCETPFEYLIRSNCPYTSLCLSGKCNVICPNYDGRVLPGENDTEAGKVKNYCSAKQKAAQVCAEIYEPVCGWFNENIKCFKYPCASNYGNKCIACSQENVAFWTEGECPK
jgi:hypothetical protein